MPVVAVANAKGGVGKTTVSLNLALMLRQRGYEAELIDLDPQRSLQDWVRRRPEALPALSCRVGDPGTVLSDLESHEPGSLTILDCPAQLDPTILAAWMPDLTAWLIPTSATPVDHSALTRHLMALARHVSTLPTDRIGLVLNKVRAGTRLQKTVAQRYEHWSIPVVAELRDTVNYTLSSYHGMGVVELPSNRTSADQPGLSGMTDWVVRHLARPVIHEV